MYLRYIDKEMAQIKRTNLFINQAKQQQKTVAKGIRGTQQDMLKISA